MKNRKTGKDRLKKYAYGGEPETGGSPKPTRLTAKQIRTKYKSNPYVSGGREGWGEVLDKELPLSKVKVRDAVLNAVKQTGISPSLLYSSAMEEGLDKAIVNPDDVSAAYNMWSVKNPDSAEKFPVDGFYNYGLDRFGETYQGLIKKGYLPKTFVNNFTTYDALNEKKEKIKTAAFLSDQDALMAKAALIKDTQDQLNSYTTSKKYKLTPKQQDFFTLAGYNGGTGNMQKMIDSYNEKGYLKDDSFLNPDFKPASYSSIYTNVQRRLQNRDVLDKEKYFATGGVVDGLAGMIPGLANGIIDLFENDPRAYSTQPTYNASTMRNMVTPYNNFAMGGVLDDLGLDEDQLAQLQEYADQNNITIEELLQQLQDSQEGNDEDSEYDEEGADDENQEEAGYGGLINKYAMGGGIHIKKKNRGKFTAAANKAGMGVQAYASKVLASKTASSTLKKRANFAKNASRWKHAMGGSTGPKIPIEVEGNEILETPNGMMAKVKGPSHENGGVDVNVPGGTKIFSDRLTIEGKTMQERKMGRERAIKRIEKALSKNPVDVISKNTYKRTIENTEAEEAQDMALQEAANSIYQGKQQYAYGGMTRKKYAYGDGPGVPYLDKRGWNYQNLLGILEDPTNFNTGDFQFNSSIKQVPKQSPTNFNTGDFEFNSTINQVPMQNPRNFNTGDFEFSGGVNQVPKGQVGGGDGEDSTTDKNGLGLTTGDYVGLAGNLFNAIAPIINTKNAAKATKPNINRFRGFGHDALEDNMSAQSLAAANRGETIMDIDTTANSARSRARNSASSLSTIRALDAVTDMGTQKAKVAANTGFSNQMIGLLEQRGQLENIQDRYEMSGEAQRDIQDKQDVDNYYSNMASNLTNLGTNVQGIGRSLNVSRSNKVDRNLLSQLSRYGLSFDDEGNIISIKQ